MRDLSNFNIICIGDSVTKGVYLDGENIKKVDDNPINMVNQHFNCNIMNFSVLGQSALCSIPNSRYPDGPGSCHPCILHIL